MPGSPIDVDSGKVRDRAALAELEELWRDVVDVASNADWPELVQEALKRFLKKFRKVFSERPESERLQWLYDQSTVVAMGGDVKITFIPHFLEWSGGESVIDLGEWAI